MPREKSDEKYIFRKGAKSRQNLRLHHSGHQHVSYAEEPQGTVIIEPVNRKLKRYELPLYKRANGQYVLHRILQAKEEGYVIRGDNCWTKEYPVRQEQILGVVTGFYRDNTYISVRNPLYRLYVHLWCDFFWVHRTAIRLKRRLIRGRKNK